MQPVMDAEIARHGEHAPLLEGVDLAPVLAAVRSLLAGTPMAGTQLRAVLGERFPDLPAAAVAAEARRLSRFWHQAATTHHVRLVPADERR